jgi:hypothetical protein
MRLSGFGQVRVVEPMLQVSMIGIVGRSPYTSDERIAEIDRMCAL